MGGFFKKGGALALLAGGGDFKADGSVPMTGTLNMNLHKIDNVSLLTVSGGYGQPFTEYGSSGIKGSTLVVGSNTIMIGDYREQELRIKITAAGIDSKLPIQLPNDPRNPLDAATMQYVDKRAKRTCRFVVGTAAAGWTSADCDYLCDGEDDQVEINAAIQALPAAGGEIILLDGEYRLMGEVLFNKPYSVLRGTSLAVLLKKFTSGSSFGSAIKVENANFSTLSTVRIVDTYTNRGSGEAVKVLTSREFQITEVHAESCYYGIWVEGSERVRISECVIDSSSNTSKSTGIYSYSQGTSCIIRENYIKGFSTGISTSYLGDCIERNEIVECTIGISNARWSGRSTIINNKISSGDKGIYIYLGSSWIIKNNVITGCKIGININGGSYHSISENYVNGSTAGIQLTVAYTGYVDNPSMGVDHCNIFSNYVFRPSSGSGDTIILDGTLHTFNTIIYNYVKGKDVVIGGTNNYTLRNLT